MSTATESLWPLTTAAGIALLLFGVVAGPAFAAGGLICLVLGLGGWVAELRAAPAAPAAPGPGEDAGGG